MYNAKAVIVGIIIFAGIFSAPFWVNFNGTRDYKRPELVLPKTPNEFKHNKFRCLPLVSRFEILRSKHQNRRDR